MLLVAAPTGFFFAPRQRFALPMALLRPTSLDAALEVIELAIEDGRWRPTKGRARQVPPKAHGVAALPAVLRPSSSKLAAGAGVLEFRRRQSD
jgi:hypothetical protein